VKATRRRPGTFPQEAPPQLPYEKRRRNPNTVKLSRAAKEDSRIGLVERDERCVRGQQNLPPLARFSQHRLILRGGNVESLHSPTVKLNRKGVPLNEFDPAMDNPGIIRKPTVFWSAGRLSIRKRSISSWRNHGVFMQTDTDCSINLWRSGRALCVHELRAPSDPAANRVYLDHIKGVGPMVRPGHAVWNFTLGCSRSLTPEPGATTGAGTGFFPQFATGHGSR